MFIALSILFTYIFGAQITYRAIEKKFTRENQGKMSKSDIESKLDDKKLVAAFWPFFFFFIWAPRKITVRVDNFIESHRSLPEILPPDNTVRKGAYR